MDRRSVRGVLRLVLVLVVLVVAGVAVAAFAFLRSDSGGSGRGELAGSPIALLDPPVVLLDSRAGSTTFDGDYAGGGPIKADAPVELRVRGRSPAGGDSAMVVLTVTAFAVGDGVVPSVSVSACNDAGQRRSSSITQHVVVPLGSADTVCVTTTGIGDARVELAGFVDPAVVRPVKGRVRVVDTRADGETADDRFASIGVRPERSTLRVPVTLRFDGFDGVGAVVVGLSVDGVLESGEASMFAAESSMPDRPQLDYAAGEPAGVAAVVPLGASGDLCVTTTGRTDIVVDIIAVIPATVVSSVVGDGECPDQSLFPSRRMVAMYGTKRSERLGVLGEQDPAAAVARMEEIVAPWRAGDRPVQPAFELIATLATETAEDRGVYNLQSSPEFIQEYLDVARRNGYYLILDLQPGQSDFLTEARHYEEFLRQPDVGLALDPEWRTQPPAIPQGGRVGSVHATEVNAVLDYVASIVAEEELPEKLVVVHQFEERMVINRDQLIEPPGVALTIHMDGFGDRPNKQATWETVKAGPPWNMALKLFFDEDTSIYTATDILSGAFEPIPDLITYQ